MSIPFQQSHSFFFLKRSFSRIVMFSLLALCMNANAVDNATESLNRDFFLAAQFNHLGGLKEAIARGVDKNAKEHERGETALMLAIREDAQKTTEFLINTNGVDVNAQSNNGNNALMLAAYLGRKATVEMLIAHGAEVNKTGWTALHYAAYAGNDAIVSILLEHAAYIDAAAPDNVTPLMMAVRANKTSVVKLLLAEGADPTLTTDQGDNALAIAKKSEFWGMSEILEPTIAQFKAKYHQH